MANALRAVEDEEGSDFVNIVAHSFGGILVRTYLQAPGYQGDVNRVMTVGSPHSGIGGDLSLGLATDCATAGALVGWPVTCFETATGLSDSFLWLPDTGLFLNDLDRNGTGGLAPPLPPLLSPLTPNYDIIAGQAETCLFGCSLEPDDGLITTAGNELCNPTTGLCGEASILEEINPGVPSGLGLCHSGALIGTYCLPFVNVPMVAVNDTTHPLWPKLCNFLSCFRLLGSWNGLATITSPEGAEIVAMSASFVQTDSAMVATVVFTEEGDVPITNTVTYSMATGNITFSDESSDGEVILANATYSFDAQQGLVITGSGQSDESDGGSGTLIVSPDGLTMSANNVIITESEGQSSGSGGFTVSADGTQIQGSASTADGVLYNWLAVRQ